MVYYMVVFPSLVSRSLTSVTLSYWRTVSPDEKFSLSLFFFE
jgi:hypothetical protein